MENNYRPPAVVWLKMTDYMHGWLQSELSGEARIGSQRVVCVQHLEGAGEILKMQTVADAMVKTKAGKSLCGTRRNILAAGISMDPGFIEKEYAVTKESLQLYVPIECPRMCMTEDGTLKPWTLDRNMSETQAYEMQKLLRAAFWRAVERFNVSYAKQKNGKRFTAVEMIEAFCTYTHTPDQYVEAMRREWQRRVKRGENQNTKPGESNDKPVQILQYL